VQRGVRGQVVYDGLSLPHLRGLARQLTGGESFPLGAAHPGAGDTPPGLDGGVEGETPAKGDASTTLAPGASMGKAAPSAIGRALLDGGVDRLRRIQADREGVHRECRGHRF
jgi:hypothetical protein